MIISASYKTDIPTFYGEWFINRVRAGYCMMVNPYNRRPIRVSLERANVDGFVFWTKNIGPFLKYLPEISERGFPFVVQHTINGYPRELEYAVTNAEHSIENIKRVAGRYGKHACVWRYDTIVFSSLTPFDFHVRNFQKLAVMLHGTVDEVVVSFAQVYRKTQRNMDAAAASAPFTWHDPPDDEKRRLLEKLLSIADEHAMQLALCSQPGLRIKGVGDARCVDATRFERLTGHLLTVPLKGNREGCGCYESRDIGEYNTCPHGCVYCYAVENRDLAQRRYLQHDVRSEYLFLPEVEVASGQENMQLPLFPNG